MEVSLLLMVGENLMCRVDASDLLNHYKGQQVAWGQEESNDDFQLLAIEREFKLAIQHTFQVVHVVKERRLV